MYNAKELELMGFNKEEIEILINNKTTKSFIETLKKQFNINYDGSYKEFIDELEKELLQELISIKRESYYYSSDIVDSVNQIEDLIAISTINKDELNKELEVIRVEEFENDSRVFSQKSLLLLANDDNFYKYIYRGLSDIAKKDIKDMFGLEFLHKREYRVGDNLEFKLSNPVLSNNHLFILQKEHEYSEGVAGYECYRLHYHLIAVIY